VDAGVGGSVGGAGGGQAGAGGGDDPTLGGPCATDEQCDDEVGCTFDFCDREVDRCRFVPDDSQCQNGVYCDGLEICDQQLDCRAGAPISCSDGDPCVINTCVEQSKLCIAVARDADQDGDPDEHCAGGGDCDEADPLISSLLPEICGNGLDDDCDDEVDESECSSPLYDTCLDPLELSAPGTYSMSTVAAALDYSSSCGVQKPATARDVVAAIVLDPGEPVDVQLTAETSSGAIDVAVALFGQCGSPGSEISCSGGFDAPAGGRIAKVRGRSLGDLVDPTALPAFLFTDQGADVTLRLELLQGSLPPTNETCGTAAPLLPSVPVTASIIDAATDVASACDSATGELVYQFTLGQPQDVDLYATSIDGDGLPMISLRTSACAQPEDEITCQLGEDAHIFRHSLPAGTYAVAVGASAPTDVLLSLAVSDPTVPPVDDDCDGAPALTPNQTFDVLLDAHQDDIDTGCLVGGVDAAYELVLTEPSDVLLLGRYSQADSAAVQLLQSECDGPPSELSCGTASRSPARASSRNVPAGSYRVVAESRQGSPMQVTALVRKAVPPVIVPFADGCSDALTIPPTGGFFQGTTANASADVGAGCDFGGQPPGGAPDQLLRLELSATQRVVLDMMGSAYATLLDVRRGPSCPGTEVAQGCAAGYYPERSFLDLELDAGVYYLQIDGYAGQFGPWFLDVRVVDP
jgi:hypothetical protein